MMLCLDCGNTRLKWGLRDGNEWIAAGALAHDDIGRFELPTPLPSIVIGCNVAGVAIARRIENQLGCAARWITATTGQCGVTNGYENPATLGADRWAALIGARAMHAGAALVVLSGTATTIDVLDADGRHRGGVILPGISMMTSALSAGTSSLPRVNRRPYAALPNNTQDAIASGALLATASAVRDLFRHIEAQAAPLCLLSGGAAAQVQPLLDMPSRHIEHLVLDGLVAIAAAD